MLELHENIRARRIALNMTQQELAKKLGYKSKTISPRQRLPLLPLRWILRRPN